jgi:hypothetical protein
MGEASSRRVPLASGGALSRPAENPHASTPDGPACAGPSFSLDRARIYATTTVSLSTLSLPIVLTPAM